MCDSTWSGGKHEQDARVVISILIRMLALHSDHTMAESVCAPCGLRSHSATEHNSTNAVIYTFLKHSSIYMFVCIMCV